MRHKTTAREFIKYLEDNNLGTTRLMTALKELEEYNYYIEDVTEGEIYHLRGTGKKTKEEFFRLKREYHEWQEAVAKRSQDEMTREELIERINELEYLLHREKKRLWNIIESVENELKSTIENIKRRVEW